MKRVGILYHPMKEAAYGLSRKLEEFLSSRGLSVWLYSAWEWERSKTEVGDTDLILSIGGDGTILRVAQAVASASTLITGVNLGKLGFMTELSVNEVTEKLPALLAGEGWIDERFMLEAELTYEDKKDEPPRQFCALNDVVVARGAIARLVSIEASIDGAPLTTYKADGVVVATATGSTGYSLAAGGPILHPQAKEFLLVPLLTHLSLRYTMVLPATAMVKLHLSTINEATLSIDGHMNLPLSGGAVITVKHSSNTVRFLRIHPPASFYSSLERKLKGKE
ncbi:MAG: NAD(+)/NADH kinase [Dehalococcoidales bacterium]|nr:NAD(+)/NADH kinase [Dehalococcoidales bacterium]